MVNFHDLFNPWKYEFFCPKANSNVQSNYICEEPLSLICYSQFPTTYIFYPRFETEAQGNSEIWLIKLACFRWMPSVYYLKNSLLPDLKMCMESACRRVESKPFHKTTLLKRKLFLRQLVWGRRTSNLLYESLKK